MSWSVKEMVKELKIHMPDGSITKSIIAALKAGQAMRNDLQEYIDGAIEEGDLPSDSIKVVQKWDKATKENV